MRIFRPLLNRLSILLVAAMLLGGCASNPNARDPLEPLNRFTFAVNDAFDSVLFKPLASGYREILPEPIRNGVRNFFSNLGDILNILNNLLQGKWRAALDDTARVTINTSIGVLGFADVASEAGLPKHNEDFGQTLGVWGVEAGPYLVLPFFGPSSFRDAFGSIAVDFPADPVVNLWRHVESRNKVLVPRAFSKRADLLDAEAVVDTAAIDKYEFIRDAYFQRRRSLVYDGNPPPEKDDDAPAPRTDAAPAKPGVSAVPAPATVAITSVGAPPSISDITRAAAEFCLDDTAQSPSPAAAPVQTAATDAGDTARTSLERRMQRAVR